MIPMFIQGWEWLIILALALLLFGGAKLAGVGRSAGRAIREFKEETKGLDAADQAAAPSDEAIPAPEKPAESEQRRDG